MNVGVILLVALAGLSFGLLGWSRLVAGWFGVDPTRTTPAVAQEDGVDYVPTHPVVAFGQHFASIAAAGPIVGPAMAAMFGLLPALLWLVVGVVFIGAVHDFAALFVSMREEGRSIAEVARRTLGTTGFVLYALFAILLCILVSAAFLDITAKTLGSSLPVGMLGLADDQTLLPAVPAADGVPAKARIGGIASTSVLVITLFAPILGWALYKRRASLWIATPVALVVCVVSVLIGLQAPVTLSPTVWAGLVLLYTAFAGYLPLWLVIQPRDYINVHFLYVGLAVMVASLIGCGIFGVTADLPTLNIAEAEALPQLGAVWPFLFITIACGSVSGAHGLVAGGTTSKQLRSEGHARWVAYGGMLLESLLGICVLLLIAAGLGFAGYKHMVWEEGAPGAGVAFAVAVGQGIFRGLGSPESAPGIAAYGTVFGILLLEGFLVTTIDTVIRLSRYLLEEVWATVFTEVPAVLRSRLANTVLVIVPIAILAFGAGYKTIWPLFGSANQLLASLTLVAAAVWFWQRERRAAALATAVPAGFMMVTTLTALVAALRGNVAAGDPALALAAGVLLGLGLGVLAVVARLGWGAQWRTKTS